MSALEELKILASSKAVGFQVTYSEGEDLWFGEVHSAAKSECAEWKRRHSLDELLAEMRQFMAEL